MKTFDRRAWHRARYWRWRLNHCCVRCGFPSHYALCFRHRIQANHYLKKRRKICKRNRTCVRCGSYSGSLTLCEKHRISQSDYMRKRRNEHKANSNRT